MATVTGRIKEIKQPNGGYLRPSELQVTMIDDVNILHEKEKLTPQSIGKIVDYLTRFNCGYDSDNAFKYALKGARRAGMQEIADNLLSEIKGLDNNSIINACKLSYFDVWYRNPITLAIPEDYINQEPDNDTIENIRIMVNRCLSVLTKNRKVVNHGFEFCGISGTGCSDVVTAGDFDFRTISIDDNSTLMNERYVIWDIKVSKSRPKSSDILQLLMYWIMHGHYVFDKLKDSDIEDIMRNDTHIGIINPRLNEIYTYEMKNFPIEKIRDIEKNVICYKE